uniref:Uncharacterized protein n=1 Tax=Nelumbo nucifera TaxID=4432 RepID=A0A822ZUG5_NELNU|nr:TPA_asm: hypothetical protein HUJ06_003768 [Nelumbo nucifera]
MILLQRDKWRIHNECRVSLLGISRMRDEREGGRKVWLNVDKLGDELDDGFGGGKMKGAGIQTFGDLWKRKG